MRKVEKFIVLSIHRKSLDALTDLTFVKQVKLSL